MWIQYWNFSFEHSKSVFYQESPVHLKKLLVVIFIPTMPVEDSHMINTGESSFLVFKEREKERGREESVYVNMWKLSKINFHLLLKFEFIEIPLSLKK